VYSEETHSSGVADRARQHEDAAHDKRNWVRLTYDCNDHCIFCLDADTHDGTVREREEIRRQIVDGRRAGATRLILSGGEPTIHPSYVDFIRLGRLAGYAKIQTVTNGRMFAYPEFLGRCLDAGLGEITFSLHGPNARVHDALVGTRGAFDEEMRGLRNALAHRGDHGWPIVNVDVVVNRANVRHLGEMLGMLVDLGVREFDLLQVVPFGRAFRDGRDTLFYDLNEARPYIQAALAFSKRDDVHLWMNRFPPQHLEGYEHLIQDPYKLHDEVRGRKDELAQWIDRGVPLDCREPARCKHCYLERLCDSLEATIARVGAGDFEVVRVDVQAEDQAPSSFGGDPASARKRLPLAGEAPPRPTLEEVVGRSRAHTLFVVAPDVQHARGVVARFPSLRRVELRLADFTGIGTLPAEVVRVEARTSAQAAALLAMDARFEVVVDLTRETEPWLSSLTSAPERLALRQPSYDRLTEARENDVDLRDFFGRFAHVVPVEGVPACILGRAPRARPLELDVAAMASGGGLEIFRWTRRYVEDGYFTKSLRCATCVHDSDCAGQHINFVRAHGYRAMQPVTR
jgi:molybdenum cofactor biosynthesis enzyme MoaA